MPPSEMMANQLVKQLMENAWSILEGSILSATFASELIGKEILPKVLEVLDTNKVTRELLEDNMVMAEMVEELSLVGEENVLKPKPKLRGVSSRRIKKEYIPKPKNPT